MSFRYSGLEESIINVIRNNVEGKDVGIAFSGGLDSGLVAALAKKYAKSVTLYTCGTNNAFDVSAAMGLSEKLGLPWVHVPIYKGNVEDYIRDMIVATGTSDPFTISYELPLFCVCMSSEEDCILTGQGADEFFMGCAKFVGQSDEDYKILAAAGVERLVDVSVPCEKKIAAHFGKDLVYPYTDPVVISEIQKIDPEELRPVDMESRKSVLKEVAIDLGYPFLATRTKKASQYGSGTTDLVRSLAKKNGMMYNQFIASLYDQALEGTISKERCSVVHARVNMLVKIEAENILQQQGLSPSEAVEMLYRKIIADNGIDYLEKPESCDSVQQVQNSDL